MKYRAEVDGLRAVAIAGVFVFHLNPAWLPGGFTGVDVFFVISGYLITGLIRASAVSGGFSYAEFYQRRIARIFPVFALVLVAVLCAAYVIYLDQDLASVGANVLAAAFSVSNFKLIFQGSYFELSRDAQPLFHYWSLAVEEQFYLLFVPVFAILFRRVPRSSVPVLLTIGAMSLLLSVILTARWQVAAFYLLPTRAWEFLLGSLLAVAADPPSRTSGPMPRLLAMAGAAIVLGSFAWESESSFPGFVAVVPVLGTMLIIRFVDAGSLLHRVLASRLPVLVGRLSYSLYLWHWPVFAFVDYRFLTWSEAARVGTKISLSLALAALTYVLFERPLRATLNRPANRTVAYLLFVAGVLALGAAGWATRNEFYLDADVASIASGGLAVDNRATKRVALVGDSNGSMYGRVVKKMSEHDGFDLNILSSAASNPLPGGNLWEPTIGYLRQARPDVVVLICNWTAKLAHGADPLMKAIGAISETTKVIIVVTQPPMLPASGTRDALRGGSRGPFLEAGDYAKHRADANGLVKGTARPGVKVVDIEDLFADPSGGVRIFDETGWPLYADEGHLSGAGARLVGKRLERAILEALAVPAPNQD